MNVMRCNVMSLFDSGAEVSLVTERIFKQLGATNKSDISISMTGLGGGNVNSK